MVKAQKEQRPRGVCVPTLAALQITAGFCWQCACYAGLVTGFEYQSLANNQTHPDGQCSHKCPYTSLLWLAHASINSPTLIHPHSQLQLPGSLQAFLSPAQFPSQSAVSSICTTCAGSSTRVRMETTGAIGVHPSILSGNAPPWSPLVYVQHSSAAPPPLVCHGTYLSIWQCAAGHAFPQ